MNEYELMTVFHPRLNVDDTAAAVAALEEQIAANGGDLLSTDDWGRRRLAYPIDGVMDGTYVLMTFKLPPAGTTALERWIRLSETTLRHLLIRGIIPFEGDRYGRDDRRDDSDGQDDDWDGRADDDEAPSDDPAPAADADAESED
ncbi:MAG: 30S ribosomal protein S6 [Chloroflexi bacterium]|nr:30S ribosomal protein S6 [Chloroflexota bacterium]